jgi:hypothetical protein
MSAGSGRIMVEVEMAKLVESSCIFLDGHLLEHKDLKLILVASCDERV